MTNDHTKLAGRLTEAQVLAMRVIGMTDAESLTCIPQADGMLVVSAMDDDGKTYALDLQSLFKALAAEPEAPVPNPTATARALVAAFEEAVHEHTLALRTEREPAMSNATSALYLTRDALLAHVAGVEQDAERFKVVALEILSDMTIEGVDVTEEACAIMVSRDPEGTELTEDDIVQAARVAADALRLRIESPPLATRPTEARDA